MMVSNFVNFGTVHGTSLADGVSDFSADAFTEWRYLWINNVQLILDKSFFISGGQILCRIEQLPTYLSFEEKVAVLSAARMFWVKLKKVVGDSYAVVTADNSGMLTAGPWVSVATTTVLITSFDESQIDLSQFIGTSQ
jgi:hypothetical protein